MFALRRLPIKPVLTVLGKTPVPMTVSRPISTDKIVSGLLPVWQVTIPVCGVIGAVALGIREDKSHKNIIDRCYGVTYGVLMGGSAGALYGVIAPVHAPIAISMSAWEFNTKKKNWRR